MRNRDVFFQHSLRIAKDTLRYHDAIVGVMGGMNKTEARRFLSIEAGWSEKRISDWETK